MGKDLEARTHLANRVVRERTVSVCGEFRFLESLGLWRTEVWLEEWDEARL